jgi:hypothetical protein
MSSGRSPTPSTSTVLQEQRKIFHPYKSSLYLERGRKGKGKMRKEWIKDTVCLQYNDQRYAPSVEERLLLAKYQLGLKKITFDFYMVIQPMSMRPL